MQKSNMQKLINQILADTVLAVICFNSMFIQLCLWHVHTTLSLICIYSTNFFHTTPFSHSMLIHSKIHMNGLYIFLCSNICMQFTNKFLFNFSVAKKEQSYLWNQWTEWNQRGLGEILPQEPRPLSDKLTRVLGPKYPPGYF